MNSVLITGGTGYFGNGFVGTCLERNLFDRICIFSRDEYKQAVMRDRFKNDSRLRFFVGDVRDRNRLGRAMHGVDVVIHAAALKRIEVGFYNPSEMVKTNIDGAMNVIEAATDAHVKKVIALSTDKAFEPVSAYGQSKAMMESLFLAANNARGADGPIFAVTRYGNVSGSTGSVIPKWRALIDQGKKEVPVTDPDCTRYWMTLDEAVELVLKTVNTMHGGELVIPTLPAYRLGDLAFAMDVAMDIRGISKSEKRHESMDAGMRSDIARRMTIYELQISLLCV